MVYPLQEPTMEQLVLEPLPLWALSLLPHRHPPRGTCLRSHSSRELRWGEWECQASNSKFHSKAVPCPLNTIFISFSRWVEEVEGGWWILLSSRWCLSSCSSLPMSSNSRSHSTLVVCLRTTPDLLEPLLSTSHWANLDLAQPPHPISSSNNPIKDKVPCLYKANSKAPLWLL